MRSLAKAALALALAAAAACSDPVSAGGGRAVRHGPSATAVNPPPPTCDLGCDGGSGTGGGSYSPFTVTVSGPSYVTAPGSATYTAQTSGGTGGVSSDVWTEYVCFNSTNSGCQSNTLAQYGTWYVKRYFYSNVCTDVVTVYVTDSGGHTATASKTTSGPACLL